MGPIQLIVVISAVIIIHNYVWEKDKKKYSILETVVTIVLTVAIILLLEHFVPFLK
ncbi:MULTISPECIES: hypothetical protein [Sporosarcina]|uniref:Uncharacterized protein n=1 Tax=Sporosarcina contaminans TaxID=633403 RepID=A0ABW3TZE4_9BACL